MGESFLIALREGFEAALVVTIVLAFVRRSAKPERARFVWLGTFAALATSAVVGLILHVTVDGLEGVARGRTFAGICLAAAALLTWMIFWMRTHARHMKAELEGRASEALDGSGLALAGVAFLAVAREGLETALFLISTTTGSGEGEVITGTLLGLGVATALGVSIYHGSHRIDMRRFFQITGILIVVFAAGLLARTVLFLQSTGDLGSWNFNGVYDLTGIRWLTQESQVGRFLAGIFGWDPRPSIEQVVVYLGYLIPVVWLYLRSDRPRKAAPAATDEPAPPVSLP